MAVRTRLINHETVELLHRLGSHTWKLSEPESVYLHRYVYLSVLTVLGTLGIRVEDQDPVLSPDVVPVPFFDRVPQMPPTLQVDDIWQDTTEAIQTNGQHIR